MQASAEELRRRGREREQDAPARPKSRSIQVAHKPPPYVSTPTWVKPTFSRLLTGLRMKRGLSVWQPAIEKPSGLVPASAGTVKAMMDDWLRVTKSLEPGLIWSAHESRSCSLRASEGQGQSGRAVRGRRGPLLAAARPPRQGWVARDGEGEHAYLAKPAFSRRATQLATAWNGVGLALTKSRKRCAGARAGLLSGVAMVCRARERR